MVYIIFTWCNRVALSINNWEVFVKDHSHAKPCHRSRSIRRSMLMPTKIWPKKCMIPNNNSVIWMGPKQQPKQVCGKKYRERQTNQKIDNIKSFYLVLISGASWQMFLQRRSRFFIAVCSPLNSMSVGQASESCNSTSQRLRTEPTPALCLSMSCCRSCKGTLTFQSQT